MKALWVKRDVPDNYVDDTFLSQLKHNQNIVQYQLSTIFRDFSVLLMNLTLSMNFILSFVAVYKRGVNPRDLAILSTVFTLVIGLKWMLWIPSHKRVAAVKSAVVTIVVLMVLTPVLRSLTESTSSDSIWAICGWLLLLNFLVSSRSSPALSTNAALAATIVLASRLKTSLDVFYFVFYNIETFVTMPLTFKWLRYSEDSDRWSNSVLLIASAVSWTLIKWLLGIPMLFLWVLTQLLVLFGIPYLFLSLQKYKDRISGPWDRARPILN